MNFAVPVSVAAHKRRIGCPTITCGCNDEVSTHFADPFFTWKLTTTALTLSPQPTKCHLAGRQPFRGSGSATHGHDWNSRPAQDSSGGLPHFHLWYVHITNCNHFPSPEELLQACSSFQCQMSFFPPPCNGIHCAVCGQRGRALSAPINKSEVGSGLFHPSLGWSCVCRAGGSEGGAEGRFSHVPSSHPPCGNFTQPLNTSWQPVSYRASWAEERAAVPQALLPSLWTCQQVFHLKF